MTASFDLAPLIDLVIAITLVEFAAIVLHHRITGGGVAPRDFALNMLSGLCLMLALRSLAHDAGTAWVGGFLLAAGIAHGSDIWRRWRRPAGASSNGPGTPPREIA